MAQIFSITDNQDNETINFDFKDQGLDFNTAKQMAKDKALEICDHPMILSWKNGKTGKSYPDYKCGASEKPFWIAYAEGRGANLTINFNDGQYIFKVLKM